MLLSGWQCKNVSDSKFLCENDIVHASLTEENERVLLTNGKKTVSEQKF